MQNKITFTDNPAIASREENYISISVDAGKVLRSWKQSLFSFEWLSPEGHIREAAGLPEAEQIKRARIEQKIAALEPVEKPVLGIGLMENVEIGIGRAEFLTLAAHGLQSIEVHIPRSSQDDFKAFLSKVT